MENCYYYVVLYKNDEVIPIFFETWKSADDYIYKYNLHAYITIK